MASENLKLWVLNESVEIRSEIRECITKISNIKNHLFFLTTSFNLYHGIVQKDENNISYIELDHKQDISVLDIDCCKEYLFIVTTDGNAYKCDTSLVIIEEINLFEDVHCNRGHAGNKCKMKVTNVAVGKYGQLFISEGGHLWASGVMPPIGIHSDTPKRVNFFMGRFVYSVIVGSDFAIAIVSKQLRHDDIDSDEEDVFVTNCPQCLSASQLTSPTSQNSVSESCPLGVKVQGSYDIETTSTSSKNDSSISSNDTKRTNLLNGDDDEKDSDNKAEKNIIFRNTEAAKEFLTRQISRMSSAGEEYLVECTEKPTRIIKENMTNVASFVYEGVKTVGDKVVTLSRHVSGSSDCNSNIENMDKLTVIRSSSKDENAWSLSQCTSERDMSEHELQDSINEILKCGSDLLNCEVWTWGNIIHGQLDVIQDNSDIYYMPSDFENVNPLRKFFNKMVRSRCEYNLPTDTGVGDIMKRERPMIISKLSNIGVRKASVQSVHTSILTLDGRSYIWGRNDHNQVTMDNNIDQSSPKLFSTAKDERIKDIVCGTNNTVILTNKLEIIYFGKGASAIEKLYSKNDERANFENIRINLCRNILSSTEYTLLNISNFKDNYFCNFLMEEQKMLEEMLTVQSSIIKPLQKKNTNATNGNLYEILCKTYLDLLYFVAANIQSLLEYSNGLISLCDIIIFKNVEEYITVYKYYLDGLHNLSSIDGIPYIAKLIEIPQSLYKLRPDSFNKRDKNNEEHLILMFLFEPLKKLDSYTSLFQNYLKESDNKDHKIKELLIKWSEFVDDQESKKKQAETTKEFWLNSGKTIESLKSHERRLLRDSHKYPISLFNASRFSSHWFILFTDLFVHINGSSSYQHNLITIWLEPQQDENSSLHQISLKMPEESLILCTTEPEAKIEWFHQLQNAIKIALNKPDALQPPAVRSGTHTFMKNGFFKEARYTGRWLNAKMHGAGKVEWPDGKVYTGQFSNNQISGCGNMDIPNVGLYEGYWKDNQQNGPGILTYINTDFYKGYFKDGLANGHGFLRKGKFNSNAASFYIGDWINGMKSGYGVMEDIVLGEKYIGSWLDNKKHGNGLIITADSIYYEGVFHQDVLTGQGIMILEDGTRYEGEFKGTGILNGKGTLTLPSGHIIEGNLSGSWNEGIKISNGTFLKATDKQQQCLESLCTPVYQKWKSLFKHCYQILGIPENYTNKNGSKLLDTQKLWQNVAVYLSNANSNRNKKCESKFQNALKNLDIIPPYGREKLDARNYKELKQYLQMAFESLCHPLGSLLNDISEAYTTTYGGRVHPLLLSHAIDELHYVMKKIYEIVKHLFPAVPNFDKECLIEHEDGDEIISYRSLLYPVILPKIHHPLFTLFTLKNEQQERQYKRTLVEWNKQTDFTLMSFLSVDQKFFKTDEQSYPISPSKNQLFVDAIETLQQLKSTFSPTEKLLVIRQTVEKMTPVAQELLGKSYVWNMDDLFPIFLYVVVRARIPDLGSELDFVDNFMDPSLESGELGIMFTTLKACYQQILQEKSSNF